MSDDGFLFVWGAGADGQLGLEDLEYRLLPTLMSVLEMDGMEVTHLHSISPSDESAHSP